MPRPELRNHGVGWMRAVERLRNGGVPPNPVFLMPATHCKLPFFVRLGTALNENDGLAHPGVVRSHMNPRR